jgi:hypothetical protein
MKYSKIVVVMFYEAFAQFKLRKNKEVAGSRSGVSFSVKSQYFVLL